MRSLIVVLLIAIASAALAQDAPSRLAVPLQAQGYTARAVVLPARSIGTLALRAED